jgi:uncharacterized protein (DUF983 family)
MPSKDPSKLISIINCKCPRCRKGRVFPSSILNIAQFSKTNDYCPKCGLIFEHETGFFWGAMYISYAFSTGIMILFGVIAINLDWSFKRILWVIVPSILILTPFSFRYSRILLLYFISPNRHFQKEFADN